MEKVLFEIASDLTAKFEDVTIDTLADALEDRGFKAEADEIRAGIKAGRRKAA